MIQTASQPYTDHGGLNCVRMPSHIFIRQGGASNPEGESDGGDEDGGGDGSDE